MYYMLAPKGQYYNYSGCGNTLNCNHPVVRRFIVDCLRYWARSPFRGEPSYYWPILLVKAD